MKKMLPSDAQLRTEIQVWLNKPAKADIRGLPQVSVPVLGKLRELVPKGGAHKTLAAAYTAALRFSQPETILKRSHAASLAVLQQRPLGECDAQARRAAQDSGWLAGGTGAALGLAGVAGLVADAPALVLVALRALIRIGYCYGETPSPALVAALFALASADTEEEKTLAWQAALDAPGAGGLAQGSISDAAVRDGLERAAEREFAKQALAGSLQKLGSTLARRLGTRRVAGVLPVLGAVVGGAVNIRFVYLLGEAARMAFAARRLLAEGSGAETLQLSKPLSAVAHHVARKTAPKTAKRKPKA